MAITDGMKITFQDNFDQFSNSPDGETSTWQTGLHRDLNSGYDEYYSDSSVGVNPYTDANGILTITAAPAAGTASASAAAAAGKEYTSGMIDTLHSFSQEYGYFEMKAELPSGKGLWPAFWLLPENQSWPPELDVIENLGDNTNKYYASVHSSLTDFNTPTSTDVVNTPDLSAGMHTYGVNWTPDRIDFYFDGQLVGSQQTPADFDQPMYLLANMTIGKDGSWSGHPDASTQFPADYKIDSITAYANQYTQFVSSSDAAKATTAASTGTTFTPSDTSHIPATHDVGTGELVATLHLSQDFYQGNAQYAVIIDGKQVGATLDASALHGQGEDTVNVHADLGAGDHTVGVRMLNDLYDWNPAQDRNLYLDSATDASGHALTPSLTAVGYTGAVGTVVVHSDGSSAADAIAAPGADTSAPTSSSGASTADNQATAAAGEQVSAGSATTTVTGAPGTDTSSHADTSAPAADASSHAPASHDVGSGATFATLHVSEDAYHGDAQYAVLVDGKQVGDVLTASALHGQGSDAITIHGDFGAGDHTVGIQFLNDAWDGGSGDRNLYLDGVLDSTGHSLAVANSSGNGGMFSTGDAAGASLHVDAPAATTPAAPVAPVVDTSSHTPATFDVGSGSSALVLHLSEDAYQGDAQFIVKVDGQQVGGTLTASSLHGQGSDTLTLHGDFGDGLHVASIQFTNDAWDGGSGDRNLHVDSVTDAGGHASGVYSAGSWAHGADLMSTGDTAYVGFVSYQGQVHVTDYALH